MQLALHEPGALFTDASTERVLSHIALDVRPAVLVMLGLASRLSLVVVSVVFHRLLSTYAKSAAGFGLRRSYYR
jgi:hypothetical protein